MSFADLRIEARPAFIRLCSVVLLSREKFVIILTSLHLNLVKGRQCSIIRQVERHLLILELFSSSKKAAISLTKDDHTCASDTRTVYYIQFLIARFAK